MEILGIDFGGSGIKGAPINIETGELLEERHRIPTPSPSEPQAVAEVIHEIVRHFNWSGKIGVGFPAVVQNGVSRTASNIDNAWIGTNVEELLSKITGCDVKVVNDADAAGFAEMKFGVGRNHKGIVLLLTIGTGIGSVLFKDGVLFPNTEFGHVEYRGDIAERYASDAIRKKLDMKWKDWAIRLNEYLKYMEKLLYPDLIIIGGGVSKKFDKIEKYINCNTLVAPAQLQNNAGIIGAAMAAL